MTDIDPSHPRLLFIEELEVLCRRHNLIVDIVTHSEDLAAVPPGTAYTPMDDYFQKLRAWTRTLLRRQTP